MTDEKTAQALYGGLDDDGFQSSVSAVTPPAAPAVKVEPKRAQPDWWAPIGSAVWEDQPPADYVLRQDNDERQPFLPAGKVCMVASPGGYGKSTLLAYLAVSVATGQPVLGLKPTQPGRVLLCPAEDDRTEVIRRIQRAAASMNLARYHKDMLTQNLHLHTVAGSVRLADFVRVRIAKPAPDGTERVLERVESEHTELFNDLLARLNDTTPAGQEWPANEHVAPWRLVILDPLSRWGGLDNENDNAAATRAVEVLELLAKSKHAPAVLVAHHEGKFASKDPNAGADAIRGASALKDGMRWASRLIRYAWDADERMWLLGWVIVKSNTTANNLVVAIQQDGASMTGTTWDRVSAAIEKAKAAKAKAEAEDKAARIDAEKKAGARKPSTTKTTTKPTQQPTSEGSDDSDDDDDSDCPY
jgi:hypothetical protein